MLSSETMGNSFSYRSLFLRAPLRLPAHLIQLLVGSQSETEIVGARVGNVGGDTGDLADDDEIVFLGLVIDCPIEREGVDEIVVEARGLRPIDSGKFSGGSDRPVAVFTDETQRLERRP